MLRQPQKGLFISLRLCHQAKSQFLMVVFFFFFTNILYHRASLKTLGLSKYCAVLLEEVLGPQTTAMI